MMLLLLCVKLDRSKDLQHDQLGSEAFIIIIPGYLTANISCIDGEVIDSTSSRPRVNGTQSWG